ncbi:uncharacterized protein [Labrus bergylta]|uniref:uncharacterized protein n=1 Tax=Labrus bergylta TaxID=56723 RepID=UPI003313316E
MSFSAILPLLLLLLLLLHPGYALISVTSFGLGEPGTLTCPLPDFEYSNTRVKWYKQSVGDTLVLITSLMKGAANSNFEKSFPSSRFEVNFTATMCSLTILKTVPEDEAVYHCAISTWNKDHWSGTYLSIKGNAERITAITVAQWPTVSHSVRAVDSITLRCSVLSDSQKTTCPSEHSVHLIGVRSDESRANIMYTDGNRGDKCDNKSEEHPTPKTCIYHFSKNARSADDGTFYCAMATCGEVLSDNRTKLEGSSLWSFELMKDTIILCLLSAVLVISVTVMALLIYGIKKHRCDNCNDAAAAAALQENVTNRKLKRDDEDTWIYSTVLFTVVKTGNGGRRDVKQDRERIYAVKAPGFD